MDPDPDPGGQKRFVLDPPPDLDPDPDPKRISDPDPSKSFGSIRIRFRNHCKNDPQKNLKREEISCFDSNFPS
jgi:hypothetical protein